MTQDDIITHREGAIGRITLNRPRALNALTEDMCAAMHVQIRRWADDATVHAVVTDAVPGKAFCAGGDIRAVYDAGKRADGSVMSFFRTEYPLNAAIRRLPKPYIALIDGFAFGGGCGVSIHGSHRVASENAVFSMPETAIGLFPDIGATHFLNQLPGEIGMYLALTGVRISAADALYCGLATHFVPARDHAHVLSRLAQGEKADLVLAAFGGKPSGVSTLAEHRDAIDRAFSASAVEDVLDRLALEGDWGNETASTLRSRSPTSLKVTFRQMREGPALDFESCQLMEFRIMTRMMDGQDFYEGVRAALIDKDQSPRWQPPLLHMVSEAEIARYFAPLDDGEFTL